MNIYWFQNDLRTFDMPILSKETLGIHPIYTYMSSGINQALKHIHNYFEKGHASTYKLTRNDMLVFESSTKFSPHLAI